MQRPGIGRWVVAGAAAVLVAGSVAGCARPSQSAASQLAPPLLYVANGLDDTISRLDARTGRAVGDPLPAGRAPWRLVTGPGGRALVLSIGSRSSIALTFVTPHDDGGAARPVPLEPDATVQQVAGDGGRYAAATYTLSTDDWQAGAPPCRLAVIDFDDGSVARSQSVCAPRELPMSLVLEHNLAGAVIYVGLWRPAGQAEGAWRPGGGRVLAIDAQTGATTAVLPLAGLPDALFVGSGPERASRVYCVEALLASDEDGTAYQRRYGYARGWRLRGLDPATLDVASEQGLAYPPTGLTVAPDRSQAYAFIQPIDAQFHRALVRLDLASGMETVLARVPGTTGNSLAVTETRVFAPNPEGNEVWVADRQGHPLKTIPVGGHPLGVALSDSA